MNFMPIHPFGYLPYRPKKTEPKIPETYIILEVSEKAFKAIDGISRMPSVPESIRKELGEAVKHSRTMNLPLARMPWEWLEMEAERQGCEWSDILFDKAHAEGEPSR